MKQKRSNNFKKFKRDQNGAREREREKRRERQNAKEPNSNTAKQSERFK
jgi:hypothetical protein